MLTRRRMPVNTAQRQSVPELHARTTAPSLYGELLCNRAAGRLQPKRTPLLTPARAIHRTYPDQIRFRPRRVDGRGHIRSFF